MSAIKWRAIKCPHDYVSARLIVRRLTVPRLYVRTPTIPNLVKICQTIAEISRFMWFTRWQPPPSWISKSGIFNDRSDVKSQYALSCQISSKSVKRLRRYCDLTVFLNGGRSPAWIILGAYLDHPRWLLVGFYRYAKFGWNLRSSFDNMKLSVFRPFGLKTPIHAPKIGNLRGLPLEWEQY